MMNVGWWTRDDKCGMRDDEWGMMNHDDEWRMMNDGWWMKDDAYLGPHT